MKSTQTPLTPSQRAAAWAKANPERAKANRQRYLERRKQRLVAEGKTTYSVSRDAIRKATKAHKERNPWYYTFYTARRRCENPKDIGYKYYGARGIKFLLTMDEIKTVWLRDNASKMEWPSIDRIDPKGHYEAWNIRFIEHRLNASRRAIARGKTE